MNLFGITSVMIFFAGLGFGLFLYSSDRKSKIIKMWFAVSIATSLWGLGLYGVTSTSNVAVALRWQYLLDISAIFIPITYFAFVCELLEIKLFFLRRFFLYLGSILAIFSVTHYFKAGMTTRFGFFWVSPGEYYIVFPIFFALVVTTSLFFLIDAYIKSKDRPIFHAQIRNTLIAGLIGFGGGITDFFPQVINIYPFGNYFILLYVMFMSYGVLKYKMFNIKIISAQLFSGAIFLVFLFNLLETDTSSSWVIRFILLVLISIFSGFLVRGVYKEVEQKEKIEKLADQLQETNRNQASLMHFMNHQVKGKFGISKNIFAELLTDDYGTMPPATLPLLQKGLDEANLGVSYLQGILNGSSAESGKLQYDMKPMDMKVVVQEVYEKQKENAEKKGLSVNLRIEEGDYHTTGDIIQLGESVRNLIDNSINYTLAGSVDVELSQTDKSVLVKIKDTGVGIAPEDRERLFKSGGRGANSLKVNVNSTGYGLVFVKIVVEAHGGKVGVESEGKDKGSTFYMELPKS